MLIINRKPGEAIQIGEDVKLTVLRITPTKVKVGVEASEGIRVKRDELPDLEEREDA